MQNSSIYPKKIKLTRWPQNLSLFLSAKPVKVIVIGLFIVFTNCFTWLLFSRSSIDTGNLAANHTKSLYLLKQAATYLTDTIAFEQKVRKIAKKLAVPPEWLMAVMHSESGFNASARNFKGSGATGLIQFMPQTAKQYDITVDQLQNMNHLDQLDYVYAYLNEVKKQYNIKYNNITSLYLAILYPDALDAEPCYALYSKPSIQYKMNAGLDEDKDGKVTVQDIDKRLKRMYPTACKATIKDEGKTNIFSGW